MKTTHALIPIAALLLAACSPSEDAEKTNVNVDIRGEWVTDKKYTNNFFGVGAEIPDQWHLQKGTDERMNETATEFLAGDDENLKSTLKSAIEKTHTVFWAYRHPPGTPGTTNPNVSMLIENLEHLPGIKSAADYLLVLEDNLKLSNRNISFVTKPSKVDVGGVEFWTRETRAPMGAVVVRQKFYGKMKDGHILMLGVTVMSEEDENTVAELMETIGKAGPETATGSTL